MPCLITIAAICHSRSVFLCVRVFVACSEKRANTRATTGDGVAVVVGTNASAQAQAARLGKAWIVADTSVACGDRSARQAAQSYHSLVFFVQHLLHDA